MGADCRHNHDAGSLPFQRGYLGIYTEQQRLDTFQDFPETVDGKGEVRVMEKWITAILYGFSSGAILFLVSLALSIGYGLMRVVNMEAMLYYSFGAYATYVVVSLTGSFILGAVAAMAIGATLGLIV